MDNLLKQLHHELEIGPSVLKGFHDHIGIIKKIIGDPKDLGEKVLELARAELNVFQFTIRENELRPMFVWTDKNGLPIEEPDIKDFSDQQFDYLINRQKSCGNLILKARYSHLLWLSKVRRIEFARDAIDAYLELAGDYATLDISDPQQDHWLQFLEVLKNLFALSSSTAYKLEQVKHLIINYALNYPIESKAASVVRKDLAELMHEQKSVFQKIDFKGVVDSLEKVFLIVKEKQSHHAIQILEVIIPIEQKLGNDLLKWKRHVAELWEKIALERGVGAAIVTTNFCMKAILAYEEVGDKKKVAELYKFYDELRNSVELHNVPLEFESKELFETMEALTNALMESDTGEIIRFLMHDKRVIPQKTEIVKNTGDKENDFLREVHTSVFDQQGNTHRHYSTESEKDIEQLILTYSIWLQYTFQIVQSILLKGIKSGKLSYDKVLRYLIDESWYGQELTMGNRKDSQRPFRWLSTIAPGIVDFFFAMDGLIYSNKVFNITTSFDSLTMKIEGIVRSLAEYRGIYTFVIKRDNLGREVSEEKDIMRLLTEPEIVEFLGEDEVFFLRYIFTEKGGLNIRNKVAHSLLAYEQYSLGHLMLIFIAILRLGRFKLNPKSDKK